MVDGVCNTKTTETNVLRNHKMALIERNFPEIKNEMDAYGFYAISRGEWSFSPFSFFKSEIAELMYVYERCMLGAQLWVKISFILS